MSVVVEAQYAGQCAECEYGIRPGQMIVASTDDGWVHERCPEDRQVCDECFTIVSVSGACMCEAMP